MHSCMERSFFDCCSRRRVAIRWCDASCASQAANTGLVLFFLHKIISLLASSQAEKAVWAASKLRQKKSESGSLLNVRLHFVSVGCKTKIFTFRPCLMSLLSRIQQIKNSSRVTPPFSLGSMLNLALKSKWGRLCLMLVFSSLS
jgi:hypothetical protein